MLSKPGFYEVQAPEHTKVGAVPRSGDVHVISLCGARNAPR